MNVLDSLALDGLSSLMSQLSFQETSYLTSASSLTCVHIILGDFIRMMQEFFLPDAHLLLVEYMTSTHFLLSISLRGLLELLHDVARKFLSVFGSRREVSN